MPRGFHPCFGGQEWTNGNQALLSFASDGHTYFYFDVPPVIWNAYSDGSLTGGQWNAGVRGAMGPYIRIG